MALLPVSDALERVLAQAKPLPSELVPLPRRMAACSRPISRRCAPNRPRTSPRWTAMPCARRMSLPRPSISRSSAKSPPAARLPAAVNAGEAVRIFTGGVVPPGADTIVIQENTERDGDRVRIQKTTPVNKHIRRAGLDFKAGDVLLAARPLPDRPRPDARRLHEQRDPSGRPPRQGRGARDRRRTGDGRAASRAPGQIVYSNGYSVTALARGEGAEVIDLGIVPDRLEDTIAAIRRARERRRRRAW